MTSWKRIHEWFIKALEEPFFRAEMHRVDMYLPEKKEPRLQLMEGGGKADAIKVPVKIKGVRSFTLENKA